MNSSTVTIKLSMVVGSLFSKLILSWLMKIYISHYISVLFLKRYYWLEKINQTFICISLELSNVINSSKENHDWLSLERDQFTSACINPCNIISWLILSSCLCLHCRLNSTLCYCLQPDVTPLLGHMRLFSYISIHQAYKRIHAKTSSSKAANGKTLGKSFHIWRNNRRKNRYA